MILLGLRVRVKIFARRFYGFLCFPGVSTYTGEIQPNPLQRRGMISHNLTLHQGQKQMWSPI